MSDIVIWYEPAESAGKLCFSCAVKAVVNGEWVIPSVEDMEGTDGNDMRDFTCRDCKRYII